MSYHASLSPSSAHRWKSCTASIKHTHGMTDEGHAMSRIGTADHAVAAECLIHSIDPADFLGREFWFLDGRNEGFKEEFPAGTAPKHTVTFDQEHVDMIEQYVNYVLHRQEVTGGVLYVERSVPVQHITGEEKAPGVPATGSSDAILAYGDTIEIIDAKFGHDRVWAYEVVKPERTDPITGEAVPAVIAPNDQMAMYASGSIELLRLFHAFEHVRMTIVQPRVQHISEHGLSVVDLNAHIATLREAANEMRENPTYRPSDDNCKYCKGRMSCKARDEHVLSSALDGFDTIADIKTAKLKHVTDEYLGYVYERLDEFERWISDQRLKAWEALCAGKPLVRSDGLRYKLVLGKRPARKWVDEDAVVGVLSAHEDIIWKPRELQSPTQIEDFSKEKRNRQRVVTRPARLSPEEWLSLQPLIFQGKPHPVIALETDPRETVDPTTVDFEDSSSSS